MNDSEWSFREMKKRRILAEVIDTRSCILGVYALTTSAILALRKNDVSDQFRTWQSGTKGLKAATLCHFSGRFAVQPSSASLPNSSS